MYAILLIVWRKNSGATLQLINFSFSLGAFFAPLIARPFLCEETVHMNISCADVFERYDNQIDNLTNNSCLEIAERNCSAESGGPSWLLIDCPDPMAETMFYGWSYLISTFPLMIAFPAFIYYAATRQSCCKSKTGREDSSSHFSTDNESLLSSSSKSVNSKDLAYPNTWAYTIIMLVLLFVVTFLYTGLEMSFGSVLFTYAVRSKLHFSKSHATLLNCVFWGFISVGRLVSIPLALFTPSTIMLSISLAGSLLASILLTIFPFDSLAVWLSCALLGTSLATIRPSTISWLDEHGSANGKAVAVVLAGGSFGVLSFPGAVASLVAYLAPISLIYFSLIIVVCCSILWCILFLFAHVSSSYCIKKPKLDTYNEDNETIPLQEIMRQTEN